MRLRINSVGRYTEQTLRFLAIRMKTGEEKALRASASLMASLVPADSVLIPIPSREGHATFTLRLAELIAERTGAEVSDICRGKKRESFCELKRKGIRTVDDDFFGFYLTDEAPKGKNIIFIDNVSATGLTAQNAVDLIPNSSVLVLCDTCRREA